MLASLHVGILILTVVGILSADYYGSLWIKGKKETLEENKLKFLHIAVWVGLVLMIITGAILFSDRSSYLLSNPTFLAKMVFVLALVINSFFIGKLSKVSTEKPFATLSTKEKEPLIISGLVSTAGWLGAIICGLLL